MTDLDLISTQDLITELADRHTELIVIREHKKQYHSNNVFVKTPFGKLGKEGKGFDLVVVTDMINGAHRQLIMEYLED